MKESTVIVERISRVGTAYQQLELTVDDDLSKMKPGQSLLAKLAPGEGWEPYLRARWWGVNLRGNTLFVERPRSERYAPGQNVNVIGPMGQPFRFRRTLRNVMLIAYDTPPTALLMTIPWLVSNKISVTLVLLGTARNYPKERLPVEVEVILGEDDDMLVWDNQVMTIGWADQVFAVVSRGDEMTQFHDLLERMRELRAEIPKNYLFGVFQPMIPCGTGACHACMVRTLDGTALACTEGPAYDLTRMVLR